MSNDRTIPLEDITFPEAHRTRRSSNTESAVPGATAQRAPKQANAKPSLKAVDKETIKRTYKLAGEGAKMLGFKEFELTDSEAEQLSDAMYEVAKEYPTLADYVVKGRKASIWGNLLMVHLFIFSRKADAYGKNHPSTKKGPAPLARPTAVVEARPTRTASGDNGIRQDDISPEASISA